MMPTEPLDRQTHGQTRRQVLLPLIAITAIGALLRAIQLGVKGLWLDEAFSIWVSNHRWPELLGWLAQIDQHPPLYYLLLNVWMRLAGDSPTAVRGLSALFSALGVPLVYALGRRLEDSQTGLLAALLFALSPFHVQFAQEARMYALLSLTATGTMLFLLRLLADPKAAALPIGAQTAQFIRAWRATGQRPVLASIHTDLSWAGYVLCTAASTLTHHTALLVPVASNLYVLGLAAWQKGLRGRLPSPDPARSGVSPEAGWRPPTLRNWAIAQVAVFLLWSPWLVPFFRQATGVYRRFWIPAPTWETVLQAVGNLTNASMPAQIPWTGAIWAGYGLLATLGVCRLHRQPAQLALLTAWFAVPLAGELVVSLRRPVFYDRTLIWASIPLIVLFALGVRQLKVRSWAFAAVAMVATVNLLSVRAYLVEFTKEEWDVAAPYVARRAHKDDLLLFNASWVQIPFDYYLNVENLEERGVPVDLFDRGVLEPQMTEQDVPQLNATLGGRERVWLIYSHQWYTDPHQLVPRTIQQSMDLVHQRRFVGLEVRLYERRRQGWPVQSISDPEPI